MSIEEPKRFKLHSFLLRMAFRMLLVLLLYVLSIGPMFGKWDHARATGDDQIVLLFYLPLAVASDKSITFRRAINAYIDLWTFA